MAQADSHQIVFWGFVMNICSMYAVAQTVPRIVLTVADFQTKRFCSTDDETYSQFVQFEGTYKNGGNSRLRLSLGAEVSVGMLVAKTLDELKSGKFETEQRWSVYPDTDGFLLGSDRKKEHLVYLMPGKSAASPNAFALVVRSVPRAIPDTIPPGEHFIQIRMLVRAALEIDTGQKQEGFARPQWVRVQSQPVRIEVPSNPRVEQCDPN